jgi:hypothetical protein
MEGVMPGSMAHNFFLNTHIRGSRKREMENFKEADPT